MGTILDQLLSVQTMVALCTGIGVIFTIYQNHKIKTNDLRHVEGDLRHLAEDLLHLAKYTVAIGNASHALLLHAGMNKEAQELHTAMADAFTEK
ncbi:hypothetical protein AGMMS49944_13320 [Spirochaetia bacterium]|nr:hypothetical protein AGMMS49944_13320 [Spirochaetia bacterium]